MQNLMWSIPNVGASVCSNDIYFKLFHLSHISQINCHVCHSNWCCNIFYWKIEKWKILSTILISIFTVFFQCIHLQYVQSTFRENSSYTTFFKKARFSVTYLMLLSPAILNSYYDLNEDVTFYSPDCLSS